MNAPVPGAPVERKMRKRKPKSVGYKHADLVYAYECAADFLDMEEWPEDDGGAQVAAYREAARRIRKRAASLGAR